MSHLSTGLISAYNSLTDKHLAGYFSNTRIRRHLQRAGLITRSGRIVPDKEYRHKLIQRAHQRHVRECLAQAIFHKVLEMERVHQIEIKRKLEEFARRERVHKIKVERSKRYEEDLIRILSPRPPTGARGIRKQHSGPEGEHSESSESPGSSRPNTAPGKMQRPVRLKPIHSNSTTASQRRISPYRHLESSTENNQPFNCTVYRGSRQHFNTMEASNGISPYCLPVINNFVTPVPPPPKRRERGLKVNPSGTLRGRRLRPTTASSGADIIEDPPMLRSSVHQSRVCVNMIYCGKTVHLSHDLSDMRDEVKVFQQHCGGENLCVYKGKLREGEIFQFISRRHRGFPFSLTFFLNGLQVERLSSCCEFKHRKGSRLGGRHGHFGFCSVEGASPCYKCIIAMGLDKKPTPPPKRVKEDRGKEESIITPKEAPEIRTKRSERSGSHSEYETSQPQDVETQLKETTATEVRDDYEEDFEADDEGPTEDTEAKGKKLPPLSVDMEKMAKKREASDTEDENEKNDIKSHSGSSLSGSEREESDTEATIKEDSKEEQPQEVEEEEPAAPPDEKDDPQPEETPATEAESVVPKDSDVPNSAGESTEINISDTSIPSGNENKQCDDSSGVKEMDEIEHESKQVEEQERAKSVQEKLAEAILKESQRSSEPELSDTSTDDTVESTGRGHDLDHKDAAAAGVKSASTPEKQKSIEEEKTCEEGVVAAALAVAVLDQQNIPEPKQAEDTEQKHQEVSETTKDENGEVDKDKKVALEEEKTPAETNKLDEIETTCATLLAVSTAVTIQNGGTPEAQGDLTDTEKKEEKEEKAVEEAEEKEQEAKSSKEDESSASEPNTETVETAATDNADAEAMTGSGTMEIKAEPSEERAALSCEEAPVTGTETSHLGDNEDRATGTKSEVTEGSGDTAGDKTADTSEKDAKEESVQDIKEEVLALEASEDKGDLREESDQMEDKAEEEEKLTNAGKMAEGEHGEENKEQCEDQTEEEKSNESKTKENTDDISTEEQSDKTHSDEKQFEKVEETGRSEKTENAEDAENKNNEDEVMEEAAAAVILAAAAGAMSETITAADEPKKEQIENKVEQSGTTKTEHHEESQETKVVEVEKSTVKEKDSQNRKDADMDEDGVKTDGNMESEDAANATLLTVATAGMSNTMEADDVAKESEKGGDNSERREVDAENGEESKPQGDEGEAPTVEENGVIAAEGMENEKTEETTERETTAESGDCAEKQENIKSASASDSAEAKEEDDNVEQQHQSGVNDEETEKSDAHLKEESESDRKRDGEETKQDENANLSEPDYENMDTKESNNIQENIKEVIVVSSLALAQSTTPTAADSDNTPLTLERSTALSDHHNDDKHPNTDDNTDLSAADGDNGNTEEASKASEEGASVLLKPQAQSEQPEPLNEADKAGEKDTVIEETAEVLAREDLVTNWVTMHQTSKFFETFVEPLEDLKEGTSDGDSKEEVTPPAELQRSVSPQEKSETEEQEHTPKDVKGDEEKSKEGSVELDVESTGERDKEKEALQEKEETEVQDLVLKTESERAEDLKERQGSLEGATTQENTDQADVSNTIVESIDCATPSVISGKPESEDKTSHDAEMNEKQATDLSLLKTEEQPQQSPSPDFKDQGDTLEKSQEVTEISEFTESRSEDGVQKEPRHEDIKPKVSDANINGERKDLELIHDIKHTLSKERLSTLSVDETLFAPSSYPLLAAAQTESGH